MEHGWLHHGTTLYDPALIVPFLVVADGRVSAGARLQCQRSLVDLAPTLLELAGLAVPGDLDGESLAADLARGQCRGPRVAFSELVTPLYKREAGIPMTSVRTSQEKLILHHQDEAVELYDLSSDTDETENLSKQTPEAVNELRAKIDVYLSGRLVAPEATTPLPGGLENQLKALGYLE